MALYYYDDYDPGPSYYDPEPDFYSPSVQYDAYYEDPGPEPAFDDYHPASYDDAHGSPFYHAENTFTTPYDFLADAPLPDDDSEPRYAAPRYTDYDNVAYAPSYTPDAAENPSPAPYDFLADQPLDWEDDDEVETLPEVGYADDVADGFGTPLGEGWSCGGEQSGLEDEFEEEYDQRAEGLAAAFDATMRGIPIAQAYGLGPLQNGTPVGYRAEPDADDDGRCGPSLSEEYNAEADQLAAEFDMDWQWTGGSSYGDELYGPEDEEELVQGTGASIERQGEPVYVADLLPYSSPFFSDLSYDKDGIYDGEYVSHETPANFRSGGCTLDDHLHSLAMQSTAHQLAFEYRSLPDPIPQLRPLSPYLDDDSIPEFDGAAYEGELERFHDAFAALARVPVRAEPEPSPPPSYSGFQEPEVCGYDTAMPPWFDDDDDDDERLDACIEALQRMQLAGYYPACFDAAPLNLYDAHAYLVSDVKKSFLGPPPSRLHRPSRPSRFPRFRFPRPRNPSPPRRKRPPDKPKRADTSKSCPNRRQPRSRTPTRPRRDPPPHLPTEHPRQDKTEFVDAVTLPDEAVPPDRRVPASHAAKVSDAVFVVREPVPPDRPSTALYAAKVADAAAVVREPVPPDIRGRPLTVEQRRRNALRRIARKKPK